MAAYRRVVYVAINVHITTVAQVGECPLAVDGAILSLLCIQMGLCLLHRTRQLLTFRNRCRNNAAVFYSYKAINFPVCSSAVTVTR